MQNMEIKPEQKKSMEKCIVTNDDDLDSIFSKHLTSNPITKTVQMEFNSKNIM